MLRSAEFRLELLQVSHNFGAGPVLCRNEFAAQNAIFIDDIALWDLKRAIQPVYTGCGVANGNKVDVVLSKEPMVDVLILVLADGDDDNIGHLAMKLDKAGQLNNAWRAPGGPEIENDGVPAELAQFNSPGAIAYGKVRRDLFDVTGMTPAIAPCDCQYCEEYTCPDFSHSTLHFL